MADLQKTLHVRRMRRNGMSVQKIAEAMNLADSGVRYHLNKKLGPEEEFVGELMDYLEEARTDILWATTESPRYLETLATTRPGGRVKTSQRKVTVDRKNRKIRFVLDFEISAYPEE